MTPIFDDLAAHLEAEDQRTGEKQHELRMPPTYLAMIAAEFGLPYQSGDFITLTLFGGRHLTVRPATVH